MNASVLLFIKKDVSSYKKMKKIKLTEAQYRRLFETSIASGDYGESEVPDFFGSEVMTSLPTPDEDGDKEFNPGPTTKRFANMHSYDGWWGMGSSRSR